MIILKNRNQREWLIVKRVWQAYNFSYLEITINEDRDNSLVIKDRIGKARKAFHKMSKLFERSDPFVSTKRRRLKCYAKSKFEQKHS